MNVAAFAILIATATHSPAPVASAPPARVASAPNGLQVLVCTAIHVDPDVEYRQIIHAYQECHDRQGNLFLRTWEQKGKGQ